PPTTAEEGRSLVPLLDGASTPADVVAELPPVLSSPLDVGRHRLAFMRGALKLIVPRKTPRAHDRPVVYDLAHDPGETRPGAPATECAACLGAARRAR